VSKEKFVADVSGSVEISCSFFFIFTCTGQLRHFLFSFIIMKTEDDLSTVQITNTAKSNFAMGRTELLADS
jgi:hypothetical protein